MDAFRWSVVWEPIRARAWSCLNNSGAIDPKISRDYPRLRLWDDPMGLGWLEVDPKTLTVFEMFTDDHQRRPVVREAVWRRSVDFKRLYESLESTKSDEPTFAVRDSLVSAERLRSFLREANAIKVPVTWINHTKSVTCDVGRQGFEFYSQDQPPAVLRLQWSDVTPLEWGPIIDWCGRLRQFLENCLDGQPKE